MLVSKQQMLAKKFTRTANANNTATDLETYINQNANVKFITDANTGGN